MLEEVLLQLPIAEASKDITRKIAMKINPVTHPELLEDEVLRVVLVVV